MCRVKATPDIGKYPPTCDALSPNLSTFASIVFAWSKLSNAYHLVLAWRWRHELVVGMVHAIVVVAMCPAGMQSMLELLVFLLQLLTGCLQLLADIHDLSCLPKI